VCVFIESIVVLRALLVAGVIVFVATVTVTAMCVRVLTLQNCDDSEWKGRLSDPVSADVLSVGHDV